MMRGIDLLTTEGLNALSSPTVGALGASAWVVASNASVEIQNFAVALQSAGYPVWVCDGTADNVEIKAAFNAGVAFGIPFSVHFASGTYNIAAEIAACPSNMHLIFDHAAFVATAAMTRMFGWLGSWTKVSSEGVVSFDGTSQAEKALYMPGYGTSGTLDKYLNWRAITTLTGFTVNGFAFTYGKHYKIKDFTSYNQKYALSWTGFENIEVDSWNVIADSSAPAQSLNALDLYPTTAPPFGKHVVFKNIYIDCGYYIYHAWSASPGVDQLRSLEDVQIDHLFIKNAPKYDSTPIIWAWVNGFKMTNFTSEGAEIIIQGANLHLAHGDISRCPSEGLSIHALATGVRDVVLDDIVSRNNGHFATTTRLKAGIIIFGNDTTTPKQLTERVVMSNVRCYDDQAQMTNLLATNAAALQKLVVMASLFSNKQWWYVGQRVTISDLTPLTETAEIAAIDYTTKTITMLNNLANDYTVAQTARVTGIQTQEWGVHLGGYLKDIKFGDGCDFRGNKLFGVLESNIGHGLNVDRIEGNVKVKTVELDLSGGAIDVAVFSATTPCQIIGYTLIYTEASSADAGVNVRLGRYNVGAALDDDYYDVSVSEVNKALGYTKSFQFADLTNTKIAVGDTVTLGTVGGKTGTGNVIAVLQIVESSD